MARDLDPTEEYDGRITVRLLDDIEGTETIKCASFEEAIEVVKEHQYSVTAAKIIDRDDNVVFSSIDTDITAWESVWKQEKRRLGVEVEEWDCPYDEIACFADDFCVRCKMDSVQDQR